MLRLEVSFCELNGHKHGKKLTGLESKFHQSFSRTENPCCDNLGSPRQFFNIFSTHQWIDWPFHPIGSISPLRSVPFIPEPGQLTMQPPRDVKLAPTNSKS